MIYTLVTGFAGPVKTMSDDGLSASHSAQRDVPVALTLVQLPQRHSPVTQRPGRTPSSSAKVGTGGGDAMVPLAAPDVAAVVSRRARAAAAAAMAFLLFAALAAAFLPPELFLVRPTRPALDDDDDAAAARLAGALLLSSSLSRSVATDSSDSSSSGISPLRPAAALLAVDVLGLLPVIWIPTESLPSCPPMAPAGVGANVALPVMEVTEDRPGREDRSPGLLSRSAGGWRRVFAAC